MTYKIHIFFLSFSYKINSVSTGYAMNFTFKQRKNILFLFTSFGNATGIIIFPKLLTVFTLLFFIKRY